MNYFLIILKESSYIPILASNSKEELLKALEKSRPIVDSMIMLRGRGGPGAGAEIDFAIVDLKNGWIELLNGSMIRDENLLPLSQTMRKDLLQLVNEAQAMKAK